VLLMDGAMGTELQRAGLNLTENATTWNVLHPRRVRAVHRAYRAAGAEVLLTNTFLINAATKHESDRLAAWQAAYELVGPQVYRIAAVGPVAGDPSRREFDDLRRLCMSGPCDDDCPDAILLETCSSPRVRFALAQLRRQRFELPLLVSLSFVHNDSGKLNTISGHGPEWFAERAAGWGLSALGVNCGRDISVSDCADIIRRYRRVTDLPLFARPNAGTPNKVRGRWVYPLTPRQMAESLPELLEAGVSMVGGCCGTTPEHITALRPVVDQWNSRET
jgi:5-methyltetrahydrofolate--homocysteine methyltransferase